MNFLSVERVSKSFGARVLFNEISFGLAEGDKAALVAKNGNGKTTLLKILSGTEQPDSGIVSYRKGIKVEFLHQDPELDDEKTILESVLSSDNPITAAIVSYERELAKGTYGDHYQIAFDAMERLQAWDFEGQVKTILGKLGLHQTELKVGPLSGGQKKRVALAKILISKPDLLILDEPTNHLDLDMIEWLEQYLGQRGITLLMVTHDRYFLETVCDVIFELEDKKLYKHPGNYTFFLERKAEREEVESVNVGKAQSLMRKELQWIRRQPKARGTKSKARVDAFQDIKKEASKDLSEGELKMRVKMTRLGSKIIELHKVGKSYGSLPILDNFDYVFKGGEKIGIVGPNGVGKTTLMRLLTGQESVDSGKIITGDTVKFGFYTQQGLKLDEDKRVIDVIRDIAEYIPSDGKGGDITASQMLEHFLFEGDKQYTFVSKLSGGEKRRLYLLTVLMANPNFLILDEPTNDLDILTLNVLEEFLLNFQGCLIVVTHDRYFMDKITDHLFVFKGQGQVKDFPGNYTEYRFAEEQAVEDYRLREESIVKAKKKSKVKATKVKEKAKLTYAETIELKTLPEEIEGLEGEKGRLVLELEKSASNSILLQGLGAELQEISDSLEEKEMRWLELSELAE
ncbi:MAG: ATP-binding cassette subfamily F protein uup [Roseivirga sp.]|jgi:ATP-binding cassette subfamily F protein uup